MLAFDVQIDGHIASQSDRDRDAPDDFDLKPAAFDREVTSWQRIKHRPDCGNARRPGVRVGVVVSLDDDGRAIAGAVGRVAAVGHPSREREQGRESTPQNLDSVCVGPGAPNDVFLVVKLGVVGNDADLAVLDVGIAHVGGAPGIQFDPGIGVIDA